MLRAKAIQNACLEGVIQSMIGHLVFLKLKKTWN